MLFGSEQVNSSEIENKILKKRQKRETKTTRTTKKNRMKMRGVNKIELLVVGQARRSKLEWLLMPWSSWWHVQLTVKQRQKN